MFKLKQFKRKFRQSDSEKRSLASNDDESSSSSASSSRNYFILDENQVQLLSKWLDQLNKDELITFTDQNDIVIMAGGKYDRAQQIFINRDDIDTYMQRKIFHNKTTDTSDVIAMSDLARILLTFGYVNESSGQLSFTAHTIALDTNELKWLKSIVHNARPDTDSAETHVKLFDGENTQLLSIPYEYMTPTNDTQMVANYLFRNGNVRYDIDTGTYAYRYVEPDILLDEKTKSPERISQHQYLSFCVRDIHVDRKNKRVQLEFRYEPDRNLILPTGWYNQLFNHRFDRDYILDILLANGGVINGNKFVFMGQTYSLDEHPITKTNSTSMPPTYLKTVNLSLKDKTDLIRQYVNLIIELDGVKQDQTDQLLVLENDTDGRRLYFTLEHSLFIKRNQFKRQDVIQILVNHSQIKQDQYDKYFLYYNNQYVRLSTSIVAVQNTNNRIYSSDQRRLINSQQIFQSNRTSEDYIKRFNDIIDYMCRHGLVTWDKVANLIKLHFADQTLLLPINHLRSIINPRVLSASPPTKNDVLPFTSQQLSQWLRNNSYITGQNH